MEFSPRILAFLEHEMREIKNDTSRANEDRSHASTVLGRIEGEIEMNQRQQQKQEQESDGLFS